MNSNDFKKVAKELCKKIVNIENTECTICLEEIKIGTLLMPCIHYQFCLKCSSLFTECPVCRADINYILHYNKKDEYSKNIQTVAKAINYNP